MTIKLHAFLAQAGIASRRASEKLIEEKKVLVNGAVAHVGQRIEPERDIVTIDKQPVTVQQQKRYFLVDKPTGYVSSTKDEEGRPAVLALLPQQKERLYPVGRLDIDSEGLLLLTNDGPLAQRLTHPKFEIEKTYHVMTEHRPSSAALSHLRRGVKLSDGYTQPATAEIISSDETECWLEITISEGRNRQIRRMMDRIGYPVERLVRMSMGPFTLDMLEGKRFQEIPAEEVVRLLAEK